MLARSLTLLLAAPVLAQSTQSVPLGFLGEEYRIAAALGDVDGDAVQDLVVSTNGSFALRRGTAGPPERQFGAAEPLAATVVVSCENTGYPRLVDVDGDGDLDLLALDTPTFRPQHAVWFANDGHGAFAATRTFATTTGDEPSWTGEARAVELADWDGDGRRDLLVATPGVFCFRGEDGGFAPVAERLDPEADALAVADWDGDDAVDLLTLEDRALFVRSHTATGLGAARHVATVAGGPGRASFAVADWNGDRRADLLLAETFERSGAEAAASADDRARKEAAQHVLDVIAAERERIDASKPPLGDSDAMVRRQARRAALDAWAEGPRAVLAALSGRTGGGVRVLVRL